MQDAHQSDSESRSMCVPMAAEQEQRPWCTRGSVTCRASIESREKVTRLST